MATTRPYREPRLMELQGARLRAMRMARSWTQREMMERVNAARSEYWTALGLGPAPQMAESTWATYESGVAMITPDVLWAAADALSTPDVPPLAIVGELLAPAEAGGLASAAALALAGVIEQLPEEARHAVAVLVRQLQERAREDQRWLDAYGAGAVDVPTLKRRRWRWPRRCGRWRRSGGGGCISSCLRRSD